MAPLPSPEAFEDSHVDMLFDLAEAAILANFDGRRFEPAETQPLPDRLLLPVGVFVTIRVSGALNGCVGVVETQEPVAQAVPRLALSAAFHDERLPALRREDLAQASTELSFLSPLTTLGSDDRDQLLAQLEPGHDGLVIRSGRRRAVFLPSVWEPLSDPGDFLDRLFSKAGLAPDSWPSGLVAQQFTAVHHLRPHRTSPMLAREHDQPTTETADPDPSGTPPKAGSFRNISGSG